MRSDSGAARAVHCYFFFDFLSFFLSFFLVIIFTYISYYLIDFIDYLFLF